MRTCKKHGHCYCVRTFFAGQEGESTRERCCWCGDNPRVPLVERQVPGHGPLRTEFVRDPEAKKQ